MTNLPLKGARAGGFILALICFSMPFVTLSCPVARISFTGSQLAFGTTIAAPQAFGPPKTTAVAAEPMAATAATLAVAGAVAGLVGGGVAQAITVVAAVAGGGSLLALKSRIDTEVQAQALGLVTVTSEIGYWGALLGYGIALVLNLVVRSASAGEVGSDLEVATAPAGAQAHSPPDFPVIEPLPRPSPMTPTTASTAPVTGYCGNCGVRLNAGARFCPSCGTRV